MSLNIYANKKLESDEELATLNDINGVTLFENLNGSNTNITLSDSSANYNMIEIFYKDTISNSGNSIRILKPNFKNFSLSNFVFGDGTAYTKLYIAIADGSINGIAINFVHNGYTDGAGNYADARTYILKVVGYK